MSAFRNQFPFFSRDMIDTCEIVDVDFSTKDLFEQTKFVNLVVKIRKFRANDFFGFVHKKMIFSSVSLRRIRDGDAFKRVQKSNRNSGRRKSIGASVFTKYVNIECTLYRHAFECH